VTFLWLTVAQYSREHAYYQTFLKGPVTGLGRGTFVRYNGVRVGRISDLQFDRSNPGRVALTLEIQPDLNIRENSIASIETQGLFGGSYVEITGGTMASPLLVTKEGQRYPTITAKQFGLVQLEQSAPEMVAKFDVVASRLGGLLDGSNQRTAVQSLDNLDEVTATIARNSASTNSTIRNVNEAVANFNQASDDLKPTLQQVDLTVREFGRTSDDARAFVNGDAFAQFPDLTAGMDRLAKSVDQFGQKLKYHPTELLFGVQRGGYDPK
jgi:phospholipid/cholesterol/gamma-HCH transport system substrate-binding protein